jgi:alpha-N-arabinofuranosidase
MLGMCNIAQIANVLQASLLTAGQACVRTPTYYALHMMKDHRNRTAVGVENLLSPSRELSVSASRDDRTLVVTCVNPDPEASREVRIIVDGAKAGTARGAMIADADCNACNTFATPGRIVPRTVTPDVSTGSVNVAMPPLSIVHVRISIT